MKKKFLLSTSCLALIGAITLSSGAAHAQQEMGTLSYYKISPEEISQHRHEWAVFMEYQMHREQCQHYQAPPAGFVMKGCDLYREDTIAPVVAMSETIVTQEHKTVVAQTESSTATYTIYFDYDKSNIRDSERGMLESAAAEIKKHNPSSVTVSGYASTPGSDDYNQALSERRARSVVHALETYGVDNAKVDQSSYGETHLAVPTPDNTRMPANCRVVIFFNR